MTEQEAIKRLKQLLKLELSEETSQAIQIAINALEIRTKKKLRITTKTKRCPNCNRALSSLWNTHENVQYCERCGQGLEWKQTLWQE